jgi:hypothetical protein
MTSPELIPQGVPLAAVPGLTAGQIKTLNDCWITTAQELVATGARHEPTRVLLAQALGVERAALDAIIHAAQNLIPPTRAPRDIQLELEAATSDYGRGALLDEPPEEMARRLALPEYVPPAGRPVLPASMDLLDQLPAVRDQGSRGTCVAHAALAVREQLEMAAGSLPDVNLSEQFVYWWCKEHDGIPNAFGTYLSVGMRCLDQMGAPWESVWPYVPYQGSSEGQGPPPPAAADGNPAFRTLRTQEFNRNDVPGIKASLFEGRVVAFSIPVYDSWFYSSATQRWGKITLPLPGERPDGGHAMALVGYQDDPAAPGGGYFLVRNSWQPWSWNGVWHEGYGYIPYSYIAWYATGVFSAERILSADLLLRDAISDTGARPLASPGWNSPDLWLRRTADGGTEPQAPAPGQENYLYVRLTNRGPAYAYSGRLELYTAPLAPYVPPDAWQKIGRLRAEQIPPGEKILGPLRWTPSGTGQFALQARLDSPGHPLGSQIDPAVNNNVAQRHLWLLELSPGGTGEVAFNFTGVPGGSGAVSFEVERVGVPAEVVISPLTLGPRLPAGSDVRGESDAAESRGIAEDAVLGALTGGLMLQAGERRRGCLTITLPANAPSGARHTLAIAQRQGETVVGRLTVQVSVVG